MILLNNDTKYINSLTNQIQVFESKKKYINAWKKECFNHFFKNYDNQNLVRLDSMPKNDGFNNIFYMTLKKILYLIKQNKLSVIKRGILFLCREIQHPCERQFFLGAILFIIKRGFK